MPVAAPIPIMVVGLVVSSLIVGGAVFSALNQPWMGVTFGFDQQRNMPVVESTHRALREVLPGNAGVAGLSDPATGAEIDLYGFQPLLEPPSLPSFADYNRYLEQEGAVAEFLQGEAVTLVLAEGGRVTLPLTQRRPVYALPLDFWLFNLFGMIAWNLSLAVVAVRPSAVAARLLVVSGAGFMMATVFNSLYLARELALPMETLRLLSQSNQIGLAVFLFSLLTLMLHYPRCLARRGSIAVMYALAAAYQLNASQQWMEWPLHTHYLPIFILYLVGVLIAAAQWRLSREHPLDRAVLKWILLSILIGMGLGLAIYFIPIALAGNALMPQWVMVGIASLLYVGFAFGIVRYRLFDVQIWWLRIWGWFLGGLGVVAVDLMLVAWVNMQPVMALGVAVVSVGWLYFPLRQWGLRRLGSGLAVDQRRLVEQVEAATRALPSRDVNEHWQHMLTEQFSPAGIERLGHTVDDIRIQGNGAELEVPVLHGQGALILTYPERGRRLFSAHDVGYARSLWQITRRILTVHDAEIEAVRTERSRIVRDLHDDVGGHLLTLLRQAPSERYEQLARNALQGLREAMQAMDPEADVVLSDCLEEWKLMLEQRLENTGVELIWEQSVDCQNRLLTTRQAINIQRIIAEGMSNAQQHASPGFLKVQMNLKNGTLVLSIRNDGVNNQQGQQKILRGRGLNNMTTRARELGGVLEFEVDTGTACLKATLSLDSN